MNKPADYTHDIDIDPLLTEIKSAEVLASTPGSLKQSRNNGTLFGKPAPKFVKLGRSIRYKLSVLLRFREQFPEYQNTSEYLSSKRAEQSDSSTWQVHTGKGDDFEITNADFVAARYDRATSRASAESKRPLPLLTTEQENR
jgi:hypothetical protein